MHVVCSGPVIEIDNKIQGFSIELDPEFQNPEYKKKFFTLVNARDKVNIGDIIVEAWDEGLYARHWMNNVTTNETIYYHMHKIEEPIIEME